MLKETSQQTSAPLRIGIIALSRFLDDPRVRRQCDVLQDSGFQVFAIGEDDERVEPVTWTVMRRSHQAPKVAGASGLSDANSNLMTGLSSFISRLAKRPIRALRGTPLLRFIRRVLLAVQAQRCRLQPQYAQKIYWIWNEKFNDLFEKAKPLHCDIWLANDWITLPIAARLAAENGGIYVYDTHEFALEEYQERLVWRVAQKPIVAALEGAFIKDAKLVTAVSSGIADRLTKIYQLPRAVLTIRNTPRYVEVPFKATPAAIRVLYHGIVAPGRGLEAAIDSVGRWSADRSLYIRGPSSQDYLFSLRKRIGDAGVQDRVFLLPPVPMTELVGAAAEFDVGFFALPGHSLHNEYALPNKFFEYAMAGLALCVSDLAEMSSILTRYELGSTFAEVNPDLIAVAINALTREKIDQFKRNSLRAAKELCWESESGNLVSALTALAPT